MQRRTWNKLSADKNLQDAISSVQNELTEASKAVARTESAK